MDKKEYDEKMQILLSDQNTYNKVTKPPFKRIERELNFQLLRLKQKGKLDERTYKTLHSTDGIPPAIRGSIKHHKPGNPLRSIVTCRNTALYNISKRLAHILSPLQNHNGYSVTNSTDFTNKLINTTIEDDEIMISFDVVSPFTAIAIDRACEHIRNKLNKDDTLVPNYLLTTSINFYASLCERVVQTNSRLRYGQSRKPIVANLCMEKIEELSFNQTDLPPKKWFCYVDDVFSIIKKHAVTNFYTFWILLTHT